MPKDFFSNRLTDDFEFEDPTGRYVGQNELAEFYKVILAAVSDLDFDIKGEYHGPHEIVMDWTMRFKLVPLWFPIELPMRAHILLEPAEQGGKLEKIFRYKII